MLRVSCIALAASLGLVAACAEEEEIPLACDGVIERVPGEAGIHVPAGSSIAWSTNPPATGMHYPLWAKWNRHYTSLDRGYWLHNAEHGGVILLYNCPGGCPDVVESLLDVVRTASADPTCLAPARNRMLVAADPLLPAEVQVAAVGWSSTYTASCFDPYVKRFAIASYNHGPEDLCTDGVTLGGEPIDPIDPIAPIEAIAPIEPAAP